MLRSDIRKNIYLIRVDANKNIGMGHMMRCLSIADAVVSAGHKVRFVIADGGMKDLISQRGYESLVLGTDFSNMEEEIALWPSVAADLIIVDSYYVTSDYLKALKENICKTSGKIVYIDDELSFPYPCDMLVNYNAYADKGDYEELYGCKYEGIEGIYNATNGNYPKLILGVRYTPLRNMFKDVNNKEQKKLVENILVSTGGSDELHVTKAIIKAIEAENEGNGFGDVKFHFLIGFVNKDRNDIYNLAAGRDDIILHENVSDMKSLISSMDMAVSAAGSTLYEICVCGVPLITYVLADNQIPGASAFEKLGLGMNVGDLRKPESIDHSAVMSGELDLSAVDRIITAAKELLENYELRCDMGRKMQQLVDGYGAQRIVEELM